MRSHFPRHHVGDSYPPVRMRGRDPPLRPVDSMVDVEGGEGGFKYSPALAVSHVCHPYRPVEGCREEFEVGQVQRGDVTRVSCEGVSLLRGANVYGYYTVVVQTAVDI
eukprot:758449-Hanusia_phi.AAC.2